VVASPIVGEELLIVATLVFDELQVTDGVMFCMLPSEYVPVAVNCSVVLPLIVGFVGVTAIEERTGAVAVLDLEAQPGMITKAAATRAETSAGRMNREGTVISCLFGDHSNSNFMRRLRELTLAVMQCYQWVV